MRTPEEYIDTTSWCDKWYWVVEEEVLKAIKSAQIEAYNEGIMDAAKNAATKSFKLSKYSKTPRWKLVKEQEEVDLFSFDFKTEINKQSILKLKK